VGEVQITVQFGAGPDFTGFDAAVVGRVVGDTVLSHELEAVIHD
jgi:hypothetical protein